MIGKEVKVCIFCGGVEEFHRRPGIGLSIFRLVFWDAYEVGHLHSQHIIWWTSGRGALIREQSFKLLAVHTLGLSIHFEFPCEMVPALIRLELKLFCCATRHASTSKEDIIDVKCHQLL